jgi:hypothetical protein
MLDIFAYLSLATPECLHNRDSMHSGEVTSHAHLKPERITLRFNLIRPCPTSSGITCPLPTPMTHYLKEILHEPFST